MAKASRKPVRADARKGANKSTGGKATASKASRKNAGGKAPAKAIAAVSSTEDMSTAQLISWYALLAMVFVVPLAMSNWTWLGFKLPITFDQFDIIKVFFQRVLGLVALSAWGWHILTRGGKIRRTPVDWLILAFLGWVVISTIFSISPATAFFGKYRRFEGLLSFINYAVIYFLVLQYADRPSRVRALAETLFWSAFLVAGYGVLQSIGRDPIDWHQLPFEAFRPFSTYGNPDLLGGFLMFSLPVVLALALAEKNIYTRLVYWTGFGINVYVWIVSFTRGAWIGGAVGIALMGIVAWRHHSKLQWIDLVPVGATAAAGGTAIIRSLSSSNAVMNFWARLASIPQLNEGSGLTRTEIWKAAIAAITHSPMRFILGYGADTFRLVFPRFKPIEYTRDAGYLSVADNVHDYPLQLAAGIGVVGVALLYGIFAWAAARSFKIVFGRSDDPNRLLVGGFWTAAAAYLVQLMFGLSVTGNTFLLWVCIGVVLAPTATSFEFKAREWGMGAATVALVLAMSGVGYQFVLMYADYQYLLANVALSGQAQVDAAKLAVRLNPFNDMYRSEVGMAYRQELVSAGTAMAQAQQTGGNASQYAVTLNDSFQNAVAALQDTINFVPDEYDNYVFIASVYNAGGNFLDPKYFQDAIAWAKKGIEVEPYGPAIRVEYARALVSSGQLDAGLNMLESAWAMDHAYVDAAELLAQVYEQKGQYAQAADVLRQTQAANPSDTSIAPLLKAAEASATAASSTPATAK